MVGLLALSGIEWSWALAGLALLHFLIVTVSGIFLTLETAVEREKER